MNTPDPSSVRHVDDFIDDPTSNKYAASWFESFRRPSNADSRFDFSQQCGYKDYR